MNAPVYRDAYKVTSESLRLLREKQAESRLQTLRDLLAEGLSSVEPVVWEKDAFLKKVKADTRSALNSHLKPVRILRISGITGTTISVRSGQTDILIRYLALFLFLSDHNIGTPPS